VGIQDRTFDGDNQLVYTRSMMDRMMGFLGDRILVNGRPDFVQSVATMAYRVRLLNGSHRVSSSSRATTASRLRSSATTVDFSKNLCRRHT
jgi:FtsP/CotA-like multicopper oxidase with cupredoxin domain